MLEVGSGGEMRIEFNLGWDAIKSVPNWKSLPENTPWLVPEINGPSLNPIYQAMYRYGEIFHHQTPKGAEYFRDGPAWYGRMKTQISSH